MLSYDSARAAMTHLWDAFFSPGTVCVCLGSDASVRDEIMAACQALCLRAVLHDVSSLGDALKQLSNTKGKHSFSCDERQVFVSCLSLDA